MQISHCKAAGRSSHGNSKVLLEKLHSARVAGMSELTVPGTIAGSLLSGGAGDGGWEIPDSVRLQAAEVIQ